MSETTDTGYAPARWDFDDEVTRVFDDMLARSIPALGTMRSLVFDVGSRFVRNGTDVVDLGAARGGAIAPFVDRYGAYCRYRLVERSAPMRAELAKRFEGWAGHVFVDDLDLRTDFPPARASLVLSVLTLQFVPVEYRREVLRRAYEALLPGGAIILVEKVIGADAFSAALLDAMYHDHKIAAGYSEDDVRRKRLALEGVLVPLSARWNEDLLLSAGFGSVECFWRRLNFAAWVAVRR